MKRGFLTPLLLLFTTLSWTSQEVQSANILFFFVGGSYSHKVGIWPLVTSLAENGHNVTFVTPYSKSPSQARNVHNIVPKSLQAYMKDTYKVDRLSLRREGRALEFWDMTWPVTVETCRMILENPENDPDFHYLVHEARFDLVVNNFVFGDCGFILNYRYKAKLIMSLSSFMVPYIPDTYGFAVESSWIPEIIQIFRYPMGFLDRVRNFLYPTLSYYWRNSMCYPVLEEMLRKVYQLDEVPSFREIERNTSLILINNHYGTTDMARSLPPMVIPIGGMQCWNSNKTLAPEFKKFLDDATNGAVLISFGSTVDFNNAPEYILESMFNLFNKFPHIRFLFKWEGDLPKGTPKNIMPSAWLPQFEILAHPNVKAFVSHAGSNSLTEAVYHGVPVVLMPIFADQDYNGYVVEAQRIGIRLEGQTLVPKDMEDAVREILTNSEYAVNMKRASKMFRDRPIDPIQSATYWTEYVLRHDSTANLKPSVPLNIFQHKMLDVILFLYTSVLVLVLATLYLIVKGTKLTLALLGVSKGPKGTSWKQKRN